MDKKIAAASNGAGVITVNAQGWAEAMTALDQMALIQDALDRAGIPDTYPNGEKRPTYARVMIAAADWQASNEKANAGPAPDVGF